MTTTAECIGVLARPVMLGDPEATALASKAVDEFVSAYAHGPFGPLPALHELHAAWRKCDLHGVAAAAILLDIETRIEAAASA